MYDKYLASIISICVLQLFIRIEISHNIPLKISIAKSHKPYYQ